nr:reverse transcriptase [Tanacetum cinerariifolium]
DISIDFIESLPLSHGKSALLVVVDGLSKSAYFLPITHPYTASQVAQLFLENVYKLYGLPKIICDEEGLLAAKPLKLLEMKLVKQNNRMVVYGLIQWSNGAKEDAPWEKLEDIVSRFPDFV